MCLRDIVNDKTEGFEHYIYTLRPDSGKFKFDVEVFESGFCNYDFRKFFYLVKLCKRLKIDIVHAHLHKASIFAVLLKKFYRCKVIVHEHGPIDCKGIDFSAYRLFMRYFGRGADKIIAVSEYIKGVFTAVTGMGGDKFIIVRNAVDRSVFVPSEDLRNRWRQKYGVGNSFVIGYIGRLRYVKGIDILIKAFDLIKRDGADLKLLIVGDGGDRKDFEDLAKISKYAGDIIFTGFCDKPNEMMQAFDIGAVPSRQDPCPLVIFELMAAGAVIVTSGVEGIGEVLKDHYNGLIFDNTPQAIADCVQSLLSSPQLLDELRGNAFNTAMQCDIPQYREKIRNIYRCI